MPITGRTPEDCYSEFAGHIRPLISRILGPEFYVFFGKGGDRLHRDMILMLGGDDVVPLSSQKFSEIYLYLAQDLVAIAQPKSEDPNERYVLKTRQYWYNVYLRKSDLDEREPLFRWENAQPRNGKYCKYHFHVGKFFNGETHESIVLKSANTDAYLTKLHVPTGYVLIEHVLRFLLSDLGVRAACGHKNWERLLEASEEKFFREFSPKTSTRTV